MTTGPLPVPVNPPVLPAPSGYSHGTLAGNTLYLGGQTALDADLRIVPGGIVAQFRQAFGNLLTVLRAAGGIPEDLASITIYLTDIPDYQAHGKEIGRAWRELAGPVYPAMAGIGTHGSLAARGDDRDPRRGRDPRFPANTAIADYS